jgi:hypothetical protein
VRPLTKRAVLAGPGDVADGNRHRILQNNAIGPLGLPITMEYQRQQGPQFHDVARCRLDKLTVHPWRRELLPMIRLEVKIERRLILGDAQRWGSPARVARELLGLELRRQHFKLFINGAVELEQYIRTAYLLLSRGPPRSEGFSYDYSYSVDSMLFSLCRESCLSMSRASISPLLCYIARPLGPTGGGQGTPELWAEYRGFGDAQHPGPPSLDGR